VTDARSRALERGVDDGDLARRVAVLVDRVRRGVLSDERLRCAAFLGDAAAVIVAGERGLSVPAAPSDFRPWVWLAMFEVLGTNVSLRAGYALSRLLHPFWLRNPLGGDPKGAISALEDMLTCPCPPHAAAAAQACAATRRTIAEPDWNDAEDEGGMPQRPLPASTLAFKATMCIASTLHQATGHPFDVRDAVTFDAESFRNVLTHLSRSLLPWALGTTEALVVEVEGADALRERLSDPMDE
jgi:hypothetical protein